MTSRKSDCAGARFYSERESLFNALCDWRRISSCMRRGCGVRTEWVLSLTEQQNRHEQTVEGLLEEKP